jgi:hypothetical protein
MTGTVVIDGKPYPALTVENYPDNGWIAILPLETGLVACVHAPTFEVLFTTRNGYEVVDDDWYLHLSEPFSEIRKPLNDPYCESEFMDEHEVALTIAEWSHWSREAAQAWNQVAPIMLSHRPPRDRG